MSETNLKGILRSKKAPEPMVRGLKPFNCEGVVELELEEDLIKEVGVAYRQDASSALMDATVEFARNWVN